MFNLMLETLTEPLSQDLIKKFHYELKAGVFEDRANGYAVGDYKKRPDINYIIHVHAPYLSSFASAGKDLMAPIMAENVFYFGGIPLAEYALPSTMELVDNTIKFFNEYDAVLMANHGFIVGAKTIEDAYLKLELAESYAQVVLNTELLGGAQLLSPEQEKEILELRKKL